MQYPICYEYYDDTILKGSIEGYIASDIEYLDNYLSGRSSAYEHLQSVNTAGNTYALIQGLYVEEPYRQEGIGSQLLVKFLDSCSDSGVDAIFLEADTVTDNGFSLVEWYRDYGFNEVDTNKDYCPIMALYFT